MEFPGVYMTPGSYTICWNSGMSHLKPGIM